MLARLSLFTRSLARMCPSVFLQFGCFTALFSSSLRRLNFVLLLPLISVHLLSFDPFNSRLFCISFAFLTLEILVAVAWCVLLRFFSLSLCVCRFVVVILLCTSFAYVPVVSSAKVGKIECKSVQYKPR